VSAHAAATHASSGGRVRLPLALRGGVVASGLALFQWLRRPRPAGAFDHWLFVWGLTAASWLDSPRMTQLGQDLLIEGAIRRGGFSPS
jgi:hypothetical protein